MSAKPRLRLEHHDRDDDPHARKPLPPRGCLPAVYDLYIFPQAFIMAVVDCIALTFAISSSMGLLIIPEPASW